MAIKIMVVVNFLNRLVEFKRELFKTPKMKMLKKIIVAKVYLLKSMAFSAIKKNHGIVNGRPPVKQKINAKY